MRFAATTRIASNNLFTINEAGEMHFVLKIKLTVPNFLTLEPNKREFITFQSINFLLYFVSTVQ